MEAFQALPQELVFLDLATDSKDDLFARVAAHLCAYGYVRDEYELAESLRQREEIMSTGIGEGIAIPHGEMEDLDDLIVAVVRLKHPIKFDSWDRKPVDLAFLFVTPKDRHDLVLDTLSALSKMIRDTDLLNRLRVANNESDALEAFRGSLEAVFGPVSPPAPGKGPERSVV